MAFSANYLSTSSVRDDQEYGSKPKVTGFHPIQRTVFDSFSSGTEIKIQKISTSAFQSWDHGCQKQGSINACTGENGSKRSWPSSLLFNEVPKHLSKEHQRPAALMTAFGTRLPALLGFINKGIFLRPEKLQSPTLSGLPLRSHASTLKNILQLLNFAQ